jgi:hypothetical protein
MKLKERRNKKLHGGAKGRKKESLASYWLTTVLLMH